MIPTSVRLNVVVFPNICCPDAYDGILGTACLWWHELMPGTIMFCSGNYRLQFFKDFLKLRRFRFRFKSYMIADRYHMILIYFEI